MGDHPSSSISPRGIIAAVDWVDHLLELIDAHSTDDKVRFPTCSTIANLHPGTARQARLRLANDLCDGYRHCQGEKESRVRKTVNLAESEKNENRNRNLGEDGATQRAASRQLWLRHCRCWKSRPGGVVSV